MPTHTNKPLRLNRNTNPAKSYVLIDERTGQSVAQIKCHSADEAIGNAQRQVMTTGQKLIVALVVGEATAQGDGA